MNADLRRNMEGGKREKKKKMWKVMEVKARREKEAPRCEIKKKKNVKEKEPHRKLPKKTTEPQSKLIGQGILYRYLGRKS